MTEKTTHFYARTDAHVKRVQRNALVLIDLARNNHLDLDYEALKAQVAVHDASKYEEPEHKAYIEITWMYRCKRLGEPFEWSDEARSAANEATLHHVRVNKHHPEFWAPSASINLQDRDAPPDEIVDGTTMPDVSLVEMCCDWTSMAQEKNNSNSAHGWAKQNVGIRWKFTKDQERRIYEILDALQHQLDGTDTL